LQGLGIVTECADPYQDSDRGVAKYDNDSIACSGDGCTVPGDYSCFYSNTANGDLLIVGPTISPEEDSACRAHLAANCPSSAQEAAAASAAAAETTSSEPVLYQ
jgi:hypothetical protein